MYTAARNVAGARTGVLEHPEDPDSLFGLPLCQTPFAQLLSVERKSSAGAHRTETGRDDGDDFSGVEFRPRLRLGHLTVSQ
jgi:hypothetical protein